VTTRHQPGIETGPRRDSVVVPAQPPRLKVRRHTMGYKLGPRASSAQEVFVVTSWTKRPCSWNRPSGPLSLD